MYYKENIIMTFTSRYVTNSHYRSAIDFLPIHRGRLSFWVSHPEHWKIYMGEAWTILFTYKVVSEKDIKIFLWNIADLSQFDFSFGKRNYCHPLQEFDLEVEGASNITGKETLPTTAKHRSGFFFKQPILRKKKRYNVRI